MLIIFSGCVQSSAADIFDQYVWKKRVLLVFAPDSQGVLLDQQVAVLQANTAGFKDRDLVTWVLIDQERVTIDGEVKPHLPTNRFYEYFGVDSKDFTVILLGKDGGEKLRLTNQILSSDKLFSVIDAMPMRQQEMRQQEMKTK
jgi:hypothetical protein